MIIPKLGDKTHYVKLVQSELNKRLPMPYLKLDGEFGPKTKKAISKFQKAMDLPGSGIIGPKTMGLLGLVVTRPKAPKVVKGKFMQKTILLTAYKEVGEKEVVGKKENPRIRTYHKYATLKNDKESSENVPWCASYIAFVIEKSGGKSTNSKMARSYERGGYKNVTAYPIPGDILTMYRNGKASGSGHVGVYLGDTKSYYYLLGGNQSDACNIKRFAKSEKITGVWRVHNEKITLEQRNELEALAKAMIAGKSITLAGKVT